MGSEKHIIRFGSFSFHPESEELFRGNTKLVLQPLAGKLLGLFLKDHGRLIDKEEIISILWPSINVDYNQRIYSIIRDLRKTLKEDGTGPGYIQTVAKKGYRFEGEIVLEVVEEAVLPQIFYSYRQARFFLLSLIGVLALILTSVYFLVSSPVQNPTLLILPVTFEGEANEASFPAPAMTRSIIANTARLAPNAITVIGRDTVLQFQILDFSPLEFARKLQATHFLETTIEKSQNLVTIRSNLIEAGSNRQVQTFEYAKTAGNLFGIEIEMAQDVLDALSIKYVSGDEKTQIRSRISPTAYENYLTALYLGDQPGLEARQKSLELLTDVIAKEPEFAPAYTQQAQASLRVGRSFPEVQNILDKAIALDDTQAQAYYLRGITKLAGQWDWDGATRDYQRALQLEPNNPRFRANYAFVLTLSGHHDLALEILNEALKIDPLSARLSGDLGWLYLRLGQYDKAIEQTDKTLTLMSDNPFILEAKLLALKAKGDLPGAGEVALELLAMTNSPAITQNEAAILDPSLRIKAFYEWRLESLKKTQENPGYNYNMGVLNLSLGHNQEALEFFKAAFAKHEFALIFLRVESRARPLRDYKEFKEILEGVGTLDPKLIE